MQPKDIIGEQIAFDLAWFEKDASSETASQIVRQAARARIAIFKTAPRDIPLLEIEIAKKTKAFNSCETYPERDILEVELETLKRVLVMVRMTLDVTSSSRLCLLNTCDISGTFLSGFFNYCRVPT